MSGVKAKNGKEIIAWVSVTCPYCGNAETVEVTETDEIGRHVVRCAKCHERIPMDVMAQGIDQALVTAEKFPALAKGVASGGGVIHESIVNEPGVNVNDSVK
jgi:transcription elongation factor Elf1